MKYGECIFDIAYLLIAIVTGARILSVRKDAVGKLMGSAVLILGCGDAFHLVPRVLNYFVDADLTAWLGFGKLVTSITMTVFYLLLYYLWLRLYGAREDRRLSRAVYALTALRMLLCLLPQNRWRENESFVLWGTIRNVPFVVLGVVIVRLYYQERAVIPRFRCVWWLLVALSFLFYIPVAVAAGVVPMLGMLMLPKTVCYIIMICVFWEYAKDERSG